MSRKMVSVFLICVISICSVCSVGAVGTYNADNFESCGASETISEYDIISNLATQSVGDLKDAGYSYQEIQAIKNYKELYVEHIKKLNGLSTEILKKHGYTDSQVYDIRNFIGTDSQIARIGAKVTLNVDIASLKYDGKYTNGTVIYSWLWNGIPEFKLQDIIVVAWNNWSVVAERSSVSYADTNTGNYIATKSAIYESAYPRNYGAAHKFYVSEDSNYSYAKTGNGSFTLKSDVQARQNMSVLAEYGHTTIGLSLPGFSIGIDSAAQPGVSLSIGFTKNVVTAGKDTDDRECP